MAPRRPSFPVLGAVLLLSLLVALCGGLARPPCFGAAGVAQAPPRTNKAVPIPLPTHGEGRPLNPNLGGTRKLPFRIAKQRDLEDLKEVMVELWQEMPVIYMSCMGFETVMKAFDAAERAMGHMSMYDGYAGKYLVATAEDQTVRLNGTDTTETILSFSLQSSKPEALLSNHLDNARRGFKYQAGDDTNAGILAGGLAQSIAKDGLARITANSNGAFAIKQAIKAIVIAAAMMAERGEPLRIFPYRWKKPSGDKQVRLWVFDIVPLASSSRGW